MGASILSLTTKRKCCPYEKRNNIDVIGKCLGLIANKAFFVTNVFAEAVRMEKNSQLKLKCGTFIQL